MIDPQPIESSEQTEEKVPSPLENLEEWLLDSVGSRRAIQTVENIRSFLTYYILDRPSFIREIAITGKKSEYGHSHVFLFFAMSEPFDSLEQSIEVNDLSKHFVYGVSLPVLPDPSMHTEFWVPDDLGNHTFEQAINEVCDADESICFGRFIVGTTEDESSTHNITEEK